MSSTARRHTLAPISNSDMNSIRGRPSMGPQRVSKPDASHGPSSLASSSSSSSSAAATSSFGMSSSSLNVSGLAAKTPTKPQGQSLLAGSSGMGVSSAKKVGRKSLSTRNSIGSMNNFLGLGTGLERAATQPRTSLSRRSSIFDKPSSTIVKDPRPLNDKTYMSNCIRNLLKFLTEAGFNQPIAPKTLASPSVKDFLRIFQFLYSQIDAHFPFGQKFEDEIPMLFKRIKYPFTINKSSLFAVGSPHTWPYLLGALNWLVELVTYSSQVDIMASLFPPVGDGFDQDDCNDNQIFFDYLSRAYGYFLDGGDNFEELRADLAHSFNIRNSTIAHDVERLTNEKNAYMAEIEDSRKESPLEVLEKRRKLLLADKDKFIKYIQDLESHKVAHERKLEEHKKEAEAKVVELEQAHQEKEALQKQLDAQELSPADVERITKERQQLDEALRAAVASREDMEKIVWEREMQAAKRLEELEKSIGLYNKMAETHQMIPRDAKNAIGVDFEIRLNMNGNPSESILSSDVNGAIKVGIMRLKEQYGAKLRELSDQLLSVQERHEQMSEFMVEKSEELAVIQGKLAKTEAQYKDEKDALAREHKERASDIEELEKQLQKLRMSASGGIQESERSVKKARAELEAVVAQCQHEKQEYNNLIIRTLEIVTTHKAQIQEKIASVKSVAIRMHKEAAAAVGK